MSELASLCKTFSAARHHDRVSTTRPISCWTEKDRLDGSTVDAFVMILVTQGCRWAENSGCTMCGYGNDSAGRPVTDADLAQQVQTGLKDYHGQPLVKIFNSGSFFDDCEISPEGRKTVLSSFPTAAKIAVESRPEYVREEPLRQAQDSLGSRCFEVGIGLETSNDVVRERAINKGFTFTQYKAAAELLHEHRMSVKTYVLCKPPFLTEQEALDDDLETIRAVSPLSDIISINPVTIQRHTLVEYLWRREQYRPPWLWTLVDILRQGHDHFPGLLKCDTVAGGSPRGPHNCGKCDAKVIEAVKRFSLEQDASVFKDLSCSCLDQWRDQLSLEQATFGSIVDWSRWKP
jgi:archaeosine synthase beta-subunit